MHKLNHQKAFGEAIRAYRKRAGLTKEKLAELAGLSDTFIDGVERGKMECSLTSMVQIAKALDVRVWDLMQRL